MYDVEKSIAQAEEEFQALLDYVRGPALGEPAYVVEKHLFREGLGMLLSLLAAYFAAQEGGVVGPGIQMANGMELSWERFQDRQYLSVFGELGIWRAYYHEDGLPGVFPLDQQLHLPERTVSHFVQELVVRDAARLSYEETVQQLEGLFGLGLPMRTVQQVAPEVAQDVDAFYATEGVPDPATEGEILVMAIDGKGVPMRPQGPVERRVRLKRGEKRCRKKQAVVVACYTIAPQVRTAAEVTAEVQNTGPRPVRERPRNKRVRASLQGKEESFQWAQEEIQRRDPRGRKKRVCLMDGDPALWRWAQEKFTGFTFVLDLFHVLEYLWKAAHLLHREGSPEAEKFVTQRLRSLLEGRVSYLIGGLRQMGTKRRLSARKAQTLEGIIGYLEGHQDYMHYDVYLAAGLPIGSGAVEGACRHLVKDRMERSGMRWTVAGAEAILKIRAVYLNGDGDRFWAFHLEREQQRRFGDPAWEPATPLALAASL